MLKESEALLDEFEATLASLSVEDEFDTGRRGLWLRPHFLILDPIAPIRCASNWCRVSVHASISGHCGQPRGRDTSFAI